jgi:hypothetical protein
MSDRRRSQFVLRHSPPPLHNLHGRLHVGAEELIFRVLPADVLGNLRHATSENALLWNLVYPRARPSLSLAQIVALRPLWGTVAGSESDDALLPYFWGYSADGNRLPGLDEALLAVDGPVGQTEVDLILLGQSSLVVAEVKNQAGLGRCARFFAGRCPEVSAPPGTGEEGCRYWQVGEAEFQSLLDFGPRPTADTESPPCAGHYQLARTLLVGAALARVLQRELHLWLILPRARWREHELVWLDFVGHIRSAELWRRMRVLAWEDLAKLPRVQPG